MNFFFITFQENHIQAFLTLLSGDRALTKSVNHWKVKHILYLACTCCRTLSEDINITLVNSRNIKINRNLKKNQKICTEQDLTLICLLFCISEQWTFTLCTAQMMNSECGLRKFKRENCWVDVQNFSFHFYFLGFCLDKTLTKRKVVPGVVLDSQFFSYQQLVCPALS